MKVNFISYSDTDTNWNLEKGLFKNATLLVGASGVGKTQILQTLLRSRSISRGTSLSGTKMGDRIYNNKW